MKARIFLFLAVWLVLTTSAFAAGKATLSWDANTEADLAGYDVDGRKFQ